MSSLIPMQRLRAFFLRPAFLVALVIALIVIAIGRWVPLPPLITGEEQVRAQLVDTRGRVVAQRYLYLEAQREFEHYLATVSVPGIPSEMHAIAAQIRAGADPNAPADKVQECAIGIGDHPSLLQQARECA